MNESTDDLRQTWKGLRELSKGDLDEAQKEQDDDWNVDGLPGADFIEQSIDWATKEKFSFAKWAEDRKKQGKSTRVIELMGGGYFFDDYTNVDSVTGVRLFDVDEKLREKYRKSGNREDIDRFDRITASPKRKVVEGDIFDPDTWKELEEADLIVIHPVAGLGKDRKDFTEEEKLYYFQYIKRAYRLLSRDGGMLSLHAPHKAHFNPYQMMRALKEVEGVETSTDDLYGLVIKKHPSAPDRLTTDLIK